MPQRIQRKRTKGWRLPENAVSVTRPGKYGNPFKLDPRADATMLGVLLYVFEEHVKRRLEKEPRWLEPLRGKDLACFCKEGQPCHADVLLRLANA